MSVLLRLYEKEKNQFSKRKWECCYKQKGIWKEWQQKMPITWAWRKEDFYSYQQKVHSGICVRDHSIPLRTCPQKTTLFGRAICTPLLLLPLLQAHSVDPCFPTWAGSQHAWLSIITETLFPNCRQLLIPIQFLYSSASLTVQLLEKTVYSPYIPLPGQFLLNLPSSWFILDGRTNKHNILLILTSLHTAFDILSTLFL